MIIFPNWSYLSFFILRCRELVLLELPLPHQRPFLGTLLMDIQSMVMPKTQLEQHWNPAGHPPKHLQPPFLISLTAQVVIPLVLATWTRPMATPFLMELMVMSWSLTTSMSHTTMLVVRLLLFVDSLHKQIFRKCFSFSNKFYCIWVFLSINQIVYLNSCDYLNEKVSYG